MGYDISANECGASFYASAGVFEQLGAQRYDWFEFIDAKEQDGYFSGKGGEERILLKNIEKALQVLETHDASEYEPLYMPSYLKKLHLLGINFNSNNIQCNREDPFEYHKPRLKDFMDECINWCKEHKKEYITIYFG